MSSLIDRLNSKIELYRLEQRYIKQRSRRSTFRSDAVYVDGEYIYSSRQADETSISPSTSSHHTISSIFTPKSSSSSSTSTSISHSSFSSSPYSTPSSPTSSASKSPSSSPSSSPSKSSRSSRFSRLSKSASGAIVRLSPVDDGDEDVDYDDGERAGHTREKMSRRKSGLWNGFGMDLGSTRRREEKASARAMVAVREVVYVDE